MPTESRREAAERIVRHQIIELRYGSEVSDMDAIEPQRIVQIPNLIDAIEAALRDRDERAAKIAETHYADPGYHAFYINAGYGIAAAIRNEDRNA